MSRTRATTLACVALAIGACGRLTLEPVDGAAADTRADVAPGADRAEVTPSANTDAALDAETDAPAASCACALVNFVVRLPLECLCRSAAGQNICMRTLADATSIPCGASQVTRSVGCGRVEIQWDYQESGFSAQVFDEKTGALIGVAGLTDTGAGHPAIETDGGVCPAIGVEFGTLLRRPEGGDARPACGDVKTCTLCGWVTPAAPPCPR